MINTTTSFRPDLLVHVLQSLLRLVSATVIRGGRRRRGVYRGAAADRLVGVNLVVADVAAVVTKIVEGAAAGGVYINPKLRSPRYIMRHGGKEKKTGVGKGLVLNVN